MSEMAYFPEYVLFINLYVKSYHWYFTKSVA